MVRCTMCTISMYYVHNYQKACVQDAFYFPSSYMASNFCKNQKAPHGAKLVLAGFLSFVPHYASYLSPFHPHLHHWLIPYSSRLAT